MPETLSQADIAVLVALATVCGFSLSAHYPAGLIQKKFPKHLRGEVPKSLKRLRKAGLIQQHPAGHEMTWQLTKGGLLFVCSKISEVGEGPTVIVPERADLGSPPRTSPPDNGSFQAA